MAKKLNLIKEELIVERGHRCEHCGNATWIGKPIALELHHIDGDPSHNEKTNLQLLCPNCHILTETHSRVVHKKGTIPNKVSDEELLLAMEHCDTIHQVLMAVGIDSRGGDNFSRIYRLAIKHGYERFL